MQQDGQPEDSRGGDVSSPDPVRPIIPNHELIRCIGSGAFGEVWLASATSLTGAYRAVKIVYRHSLKGNGFDREFKGIQRFEPISRAHPNLVNILHVGENHDASCFFYLMELADDARTAGENEEGQTLASASENMCFDPETYVPRTLESEMRRRGALPVHECLQVAMSLTDALNYLHGRGLIHRDVKPANIIFVNGIAKLADIGLVTDAETTVTFVGTGGFIPREGPGRPQADIYSLGKVFYEMITGLDRNFFPQLPADWGERPDKEANQRFNLIVMRACEDDVSRRYQTAEELRTDLLSLRDGGAMHSTTMKGKSSTRARIMIVAGVLLSVASVGFVMVKWSARFPKTTRSVASAIGLTANSQAEGFKSLLNGKDLDGWSAPGANWAWVEGALTRVASGGDITYEAESMPENFDLRFEWRISSRGDSGVLYRPGRVEYQILDNEGSPLGKDSKTQAGSLFDYSSQARDRTKPVGQWNESRILCEGERIRHFLNGSVVLDTRYDQSEWDDARNRLKSKYNTDLTTRGGYLTLRDENGQVWYRNIRLKGL